MSPITASQVKELREQTGVGMMECKNALVDTDGNLESAVKLLREKGAAKAVKRAGRVTKEGRIQAKRSDDKRTGAMVEVNIETDFAARNNSFIEFVETTCDTLLANPCDDVEKLKEVKLPEGSKAETVGALVADIQTVIGENMGIGHCVHFQVPEDQAGQICAYIHPPGKVGVLIELNCENAEVAAAEATAELAHNLCLHIAFSNPAALDSSSISEDIIASEKEVYRNTALKQGKPEKILDKIVEGRLRAYFKDSCLLEQAYIKEEKQSITQLIEATGKTAGGMIAITRFARFQLGAS